MLPQVHLAPINVVAGALKLQLPPSVSFSPHHWAVNFSICISFAREGDLTVLLCCALCILRCPKMVRCCCCCCFCRALAQLCGLATFCCCYCCLSYVLRGLFMFLLFCICNLSFVFGLDPLSAGIFLNSALRKKKN